VQGNEWYIVWRYERLDGVKLTRVVGVEAALCLRLCPYHQGQIPPLPLSTRLGVQSVSLCWTSRNLSSGLRWVEVRAALICRIIAFQCHLQAISLISLTHNVPVCVTCPWSFAYRRLFCGTNNNNNNRLTNKSHFCYFCRGHISCSLLALLLIV